MIAVVHNLRSLHNVGSIFRTADAAGIEKLFLTGYTPAPTDRFGLTRSAIKKVALGAEQNVVWEKFVSASKLLAKLRRENFRILALEQATHSQPLANYRSSKKMLKKTAIVVGNEIQGLSHAILKMCDVVLEIPMLGKKESLNVSVAFGIASEFKNLVHQ